MDLVKEMAKRLQNIYNKEEPKWQIEYILKLIKELEETKKSADGAISYLHGELRKLRE